MSILAFDPPVLTTETTCVAAPTEFENHGAPAAAESGASASPNPSNAHAAHRAAHSRAPDRRMTSIVRPVPHWGQVKVETRLGHRVVTHGASRKPAGRTRNTAH